MKILIDMNLSDSWIEVLKGADIDAVHWKTVGPETALDVEIAAYARVEGYTILSADLDFSGLLAESGDTAPSVIQIRSGNLRPNKLAGSVLMAINAKRQALEAGAVLTIDIKQSRIRTLPLT